MTGQGLSYAEGTCTGFRSPPIHKLHRRRLRGGDAVFQAGSRAHAEDALARPPGHTFASLILAAGIEPYKVSRRMCHVSLVTTDTVYVHLYASDYSTEIAAFEPFTAEE